MSYLLGYIIADGCITISKNRKKNPFTLNITSVDKKHLYKLRHILKSKHKIGKKINGENGIGFQLQIRNLTLAEDLISLGIFPRKTYNLKSIDVPQKYFADFTRGFFDGDGTVFIYTVNGSPQIKAGFISSSLSFITSFNKQLCQNLNIPTKTVHKNIDKRKTRINTYSIYFYIDDCKKLFQFMYKNNPSIFLSRKYQKFLKWKNKNKRPYIKKDYPSKIGWQLNKKV